MSMLSFRKRHEASTPGYEKGKQSQVLATDGRDIPYLYEEAADPTRRSRVAVSDRETGESGEQHDVVELVMGETITGKRGERRTMKSIVEDEMDTMREWAKHQFGRGAWTHMDIPVTYLVEYPREEEDDFVDGLVLSMDGTGLVRQYLIHEEGEEMVVEDEQTLEETLDFPKGTRITRHARGRVPTDGSSPLPEVNKKRPRDEETIGKEEYLLGFMRKVHGAIDKFNDDRRTAQNIGTTAVNG